MDACSSDNADPDVFVQKLSQARESVLLLDYDGTLAPLRAESDQALPYPGAAEALIRITARGNTRVVILTGRRAAEVARFLVRCRQLDIWGCSGWERLRPDGKRQEMLAEPRAREGMAIAYRMLVALAYGSLRNTLDLERQVESGPRGLTLHWRGCPTEVIAKLRASVSEQWFGLANDAGLQLCNVDKGLELRFPGHSKADAVRSIIAEVREEDALAYLGNGPNDEEAFRVLKGRGLTALVRPELYPTAADLWLKPPQGLLDFLWLWDELRSRPG